MKVSVLLVLLVLAAGCAKKPTALEVCQKIEGAGLGANCRAGKVEGLGAAAAEKAEFDLPTVAGKTGAVMRFDAESGYDTTTGAFERAAGLAGPHRYGSKKALIFVQMNSGLAAEKGAAVKAIVDGL